MLRRSSSHNSGGSLNDKLRAAPSATLGDSQEMSCPWPSNDLAIRCTLVVFERYGLTNMKIDQLTSRSTSVFGPDG
jgi:hypothetical protein